MAVTGNLGMVLKMTAQADTIDQRISVSYIRWVNATTADHDCQVTDKAGTILFESTADGANFIDILALFKNVNGIIVSTLDSGNLFIYVI